MNKTISLDWLNIQNLKKKKKQQKKAISLFREDSVSKQRLKMETGINLTHKSWLLMTVPLMASQSTQHLRSCAPPYFDKISVVCLFQSKGNAPNLHSFLHFPSTIPDLHHVYMETRR